MDLLSALIPLWVIRLWLIRQELLTALDALIEGDEGMFDGGLRTKHLGVFEEHLAGVRIDLDIGHQLGGGPLRFQFLDERFALRGLLFDFRELFRFGLDGRRSANGCLPLKATRSHAAGSPKRAAGLERA